LYFSETLAVLPCAIVGKLKKLKFYFSGVLWQYFRTQSITLNFKVYYSIPIVSISPDFRGHFHWYIISVLPAWVSGRRLHKTQTYNVVQTIRESTHRHPTSAAL